MASGLIIWRRSSMHWADPAKVPNDEAVAADREPMRSNQKARCIELLCEVDSILTDEGQGILAAHLYRIIETLQAMGPGQVDVEIG